jgi:hypothetical protein
VGFKPSFSLQRSYEDTTVQFLSSRAAGGRKVIFLGPMGEQLIETLRDGGIAAEIYSLSMPGEFQVLYRDASGKVLEEARLTGISTYKQREGEIRSRLHALAHGAKPTETPDLGDAGEY